MTFPDWRSSNGNLSTSQLSQRDNLIEEIMTPVPTEDVTPASRNVASSQNATPIADKKATNCDEPATPSSASSTSSTGSIFLPAKKRESNRGPCLIVQDDGHSFSLTY